MKSNYYEVIKSVPLTEELTMLIVKEYNPKREFKKCGNCEHFREWYCAKYFGNRVDENDICIEEEEE